ncbi:MAG: 2-oxoglutarate dehydrogenase complex dihydrolipoyllysine-residue succinyltransferase [Candidatus Binatia bacterium]
MAVDVQSPTLGESISDGVIVRWMKRDGETVAADEPLLELETDKASVEIPAPAAGIVALLARAGQTVRVGEVVARIDPSGAGAGAAAATTAPAAAPAAAPAQAQGAAESSPPLSPAVRRLVEEKALDPRRISGSGKGGRLTKADVLAHINAGAEATPPAPPAPPIEAPRAPTPYPRPGAPVAAEDADVERVPMSRLRQRIAERLRQAQATAAILTTFNEVDMSAVMALRARHKQAFADAHGVPLGFMSFFGRACTATLQEMPLVNAQIDGSDIVYSRRVHLGIAVGTERGLVVPIVHGADRLDFAGLEREIARLAQLARDNKLAIDDLSGGTFTISNGGVYGSLLSTPILNPPQSAILGMHKIEKRPVVVDDQIVVRPMMYLALSYDHRLIDGAEAVTFLVKVKERLEDPSRLLLGV